MSRLCWREICWWWPSPATDNEAFCGTWTKRAAEKGIFPLRRPRSGIDSQVWLLYDEILFSLIFQGDTGNIFEIPTPPVPFFVL